MVEIQYRTEAQHAWATAVELAGEITGQHTKFDEGGECQKEYFRLASEIIARGEGGRKSCYPDMSATDLVRKFQEIDQNLRLLETFRNLEVVVSWKKTMKRDKKSEAYANLVLVSSQLEGLELYAFESLPDATKFYGAMENKKPASNVVLVRTSSEESLRNAYKNYFGDASSFVSLVDNGLSSLK